MNDAYYLALKASHHKGKGKGKKHHKSKTYIPDTASVVAAHNKKIQNKEETHRNILARRETKGHPARHQGRDLLPADKKDPTAVAKSRHHISDAQKQHETTDALNLTKNQQGVGNVDGLSNFAHADNINQNGYNTIMTDIVGQVKSHSYLFMDAGLAGIAALLLLPKVKINLIPSSLNKTAWTASLAALGIGIVGHLMNPTGRAFAVNIPPSHHDGGGGEHHGGFGGGGGHEHGFGHPGFRGGHFPHFRGGFRGFRGYYGYPGYYPGYYYPPEIEGLYGYPDAPYDPYLFGTFPEFGVEEFGYGYPYGFEFGHGRFRGGPEHHPSHGGFGHGHEHGGFGHGGGEHHGGFGGGGEHHGPPGGFGGGHGGPGGGHGGPGGEGGGGGHEHAGQPGGEPGGANLAYSYFAPAIFPEMSYFNKDAYHFKDPREGTRVVGPENVILPKHIETGNYQHSSRAPIDDFNHTPPTLLSDIY